MFVIINKTNVYKNIDNFWLNNNWNQRTKLFCIKKKMFEKSVCLVKIHFFFHSYLTVCFLFDFFWNIDNFLKTNTWIIGTHALTCKMLILYNVKKKKKNMDKYGLFTDEWTLFVYFFLLNIARSNKFVGNFICPKMCFFN